MPNMMQSAATWQAGRLKSAAGRTVSITQGATTLDGITAWCGMHDYDVVDEEGFATSVRSYDWEFAKADVNLTLRPGDVVTEYSTGYRYEAMPIGNRPCLEERDSSGLTLKLHTKRVK